MARSATARRHEMTRRRPDIKDSSSGSGCDSGARRTCAGSAVVEMVSQSGCARGLRASLPPVDAQPHHPSGRFPLPAARRCSYAASFRSSRTRGENMTHATLTLDGKSYDLPVLVGTEGELGIDISDLRAQTGAVTLDHGYANNGSCTSDITFIDGEKGILRYRGYPIEELA